MGEGPPPAIPAPQPPARPRRLSLVVIVVLVFVLGAGGGAAYYENGVLSDQYSPQRAVLDYFTAQKRADWPTMMANATFLRPVGSDPVLFNKDAVASMVLLRQNTDITDVKVISTSVVDASTVTVKVSMTWAGSGRSSDYTVREDKSRVHYLFYSGWRVDVPYSELDVAPPKFGGPITIDGVFGRADSVTGPIYVIQGYHQVKLVGTVFFDPDLKIADAVDANPTVAFAGGVSSSAKTAIADMIHGWFRDCDPTTHNWCPDHTYSKPDSRSWYLTLPGYGRVFYSTYSYTIDPDLVSGMSVIVTDTSRATANGTCKATLTVDGSTTFRFTGTWSVELNAPETTYFQGSNGHWDCTTAAA